MLKCGCSGFASHQNEHDNLPKGHPTCIIHNTCVVTETPDLSTRKARCDYFGKQVKTGSYNGNCCDTCKSGSICSCEKPSSPNLWFFKYQPDEPFDMYYCGCHGCD